MKTTIHNEDYYKSIIVIIMSRTPLFIMLNHHILSYPTPINLDWSWNYGSLAGVCLVAQIVTGIILAMSYNVGTTYHSEGPFEAVQHILREVAGGLWTRVAHQNCATLFFLVMYIHMWRTIRQSSQTKPREMLWIIGVVILLVAFITAFLGYVLPWGQMSFWGATVITSLAGTVPFVGDELVVWLWGGFYVANPTLNRFYSFHYTLPFLLVGLVLVHLCALHVPGSSNPLCICSKSAQIRFLPYYGWKDMIGFMALWTGLAIIIGFMPDLFGYTNHPDNLIPADPYATPAHIVPEWYFLWVYAILRTIPNKAMGVVAAALVFICLAAMPLSQGNEWLSWSFLADVIILTLVGEQPIHPSSVWLGAISTAYLFLWLAVLQPLTGLTYQSL